MAKAKAVFSCESCGAQSATWVGRCPGCGEWNSLIEVVSGGAVTGNRNYAGSRTITVQRLADVEPDQHDARTVLGVDELDRVLGGGLVAGSVVLMGGDPGIGKSTLLLQALAAVSDRAGSLYVTGEESPEQVALRAQRLGLSSGTLNLLAETRVESIIGQLEQSRPQVAVIDSIQTLFSDELQSAPGSVAQVRECAARLVRYAKQTSTALFLVGHVTKEGALAGPRVLEHMVDTVLYFEGDPGERFRVVRAIKNRFGAVNELGVFAMGDKGLKGVSNPSAIFLSRHDQPVPGSVILVTQEGTRPLLVEVQALVDQSSSSNPRRLALGLEQNRLSMLLAVLHRHGGIAVMDQDVFVNVVGGVRVAEPAADLAVLLAIYSSMRDRPLPQRLVVFGELGLAGELRPVPNGQERLREAAKHGFDHAVVPAANRPRDPGIDGLKVDAMTRLDEVLSLF